MSQWPKPFFQLLELTRQRRAEGRNAGHVVDGAVRPADEPQQAAADRATHQAISG